MESICLRFCPISPTDKRPDIKGSQWTWLSRRRKLCCLLHPYYMPRTRVLRLLLCAMVARPKRDRTIHGTGTRHFCRSDVLLRRQETTTVAMHACRQSLRKHSACRADSTKERCRHQHALARVIACYYNFFCPVSEDSVRPSGPLICAL
jgi:hypothetical protein